MRIPAVCQAPLGVPRLLAKAEELAAVWRHASTKDIRALMKVLDKKATEVAELYDAWSVVGDAQVPAIDAFIGDIYSGLQVQLWSEEDRLYGPNPKRLR